MPRRRTFTEADIRRATRGVVAAGLMVSRVEIGPDGQIVVISAGAPATGKLVLDRWREGRIARQA